MKDIHMGDTHLIALDDCAMENDEVTFDHYVALVVAQQRNQFDFKALDSGIISVVHVLNKIYLNVTLLCFSSSESSWKMCSSIESQCSSASYWCWLSW